MSDLISRSALIEHLEENRPINWNDSKSEIQEQYDWDYFINITKAQPTAYNTDKVVEQLGDAGKYGGLTVETEEDGVFENFVPVSRAKDIVKGGGISEENN